MIEGFHFLRPAWLLGALIWLPLMWFYARRSLDRAGWHQVCDPELLPYVLTTSSHQRYPTRLITAGGILALLALAGPAWEQIPQPVFKGGSPLVIALDLSRSMDSADIVPSRLVRARYKIEDLLKQRLDGETALLVYAGSSFVVTPLTDDVKTITAQLSALTSDIMPVQGDDLKRVLEQAEDLLRQAGHLSGHILLVTDSISEGLESRFTALRDRGYQLSILAIGTAAGAPIKLSQGGFLKNRQGAIVIPKTNYERLKKMATAGGGKYTQLSGDDEDIIALNRFFESNRAWQSEEQAYSLQTDLWREQGPWLALLLLPFAAFSFRRGNFLIVLVLALSLPKQTHAWEWDSLWLNENQRAMKNFKEGEMEKAADRFDNPDWKAAAYYQAGEYQTAEELLAGVGTETGLYNRANALAHLERYQEAITVYDKVLEINPKHEDAIYNREQVEKAMKQEQDGEQGEQSQQDKQSEQTSQGQGKQSQQARQAEQDEQAQQAKQSEQTSQGQGEQSQQARQAEQDEQAQQAKQSEQTSQGQGEQSQQARQAEQDEQAQQAKQSEQTSQGQGEQSQQARQAEQDEQAQQAKRSEQTPQGQGEQSQQARQAEQDEQAQQAKRSEQTPQGQTVQMTEQWLRRIPDDPAGLLRRKFQYQYNTESTRRSDRSEEEW